MILVNYHGLDRFAAFERKCQKEFGFIIISDLFYACFLCFIELFWKLCLITCLPWIWGRLLSSTIAFAGMHYRLSQLQATFLLKSHVISPSLLLMLCLLVVHSLLLCSWALDPFALRWPRVDHSSEWPADFVTALQSFCSK